MLRGLRTEQELKMMVDVWEMTATVDKELEDCMATTYSRVDSIFLQQRFQLLNQQRRRSMPSHRPHWENSNQRIHEFNTELEVHFYIFIWKTWATLIQYCVQSGNHKVWNPIHCRVITYFNCWISSRIWLFTSHTKWNGHINGSLFTRSNLLCQVM